MVEVSRQEIIDAIIPRLENNCTLTHMACQLFGGRYRHKENGMFEVEDTVGYSGIFNPPTGVDPLTVLKELVDERTTAANKYQAVLVRRVRKMEPIYAVINKVADLPCASREYKGKKLRTMCKGHVASTPGTEIQTSQSFRLYGPSEIGITAHDSADDWYTVISSTGKTKEMNLQETMKALINSLMYMVSAEDLEKALSA